MKHVSVCLLLVSLSCLLWAQTPPTLQAIIGDMPDLSSEAKMLYDEGLKVVKDLERRKVRYDDMTPKQQRIYSTYRDEGGEFVHGFYGLEEFFSFQTEIQSIGGCRHSYEKVSASSTLAGQGTYSYEAKNLLDADLSTAWVEGESGQGIGTTLSYVMPERRADSYQYTQYLTLHNGYVKSLKAWKNNGRVKQLQLALNGEPIAILDLADTRAMQFFDLRKFSASFGRQPRFTFKILSVYPGDKYADVALTELTFINSGCQCLAPGSRITLADGRFLPVEDLQVGDMVLGLHPETGVSGPARVLEMVHPVHERLYTLALSDGTSLTLTGDHPLWVPEMGWAAIHPQQAEANYLGGQLVRTLQVGDMLSDELKIVSMEARISQTTTHNVLRLSDGYQAFQAEGVWVSVGDRTRRSEELGE